ncbi:MAG: hypothetical protein HPY58_02120 [Firmicutes bacterium]|nr:hypothetical protein [Bacillota bacterium]
MARRGYFSGLLTGGLMGAILSLMFTSRRKPNRKLMARSGEVGNRAKKVFRGISRGMMDMLRR